MYTVTVSDSDFATDTLSVFIDQPLSLTVVPMVTKPTGHLSADGAVVLQSVGGGSPPYTFHWSNGSDSMNIHHLLSGTYQLTMTDAQSCDTVLSVEVLASVEVQEPGHSPHGLTLSPHPAQSDLLLHDHSPDSVPQDRIWELHSLTGQMLRSVALPPGTAQQRLDLSGLPPGLYVWALRRADGSQGAGRVVVSDEW